MELEPRGEKADAQQKMAWIAMGSMLVFSLILFSPIISESRVSALSDLLGLFYIAQAGVVGAYMGTSAWMRKQLQLGCSFPNCSSFNRCNSSRLARWLP